MGLAALALAWCGGRDAIPPLLDALDDPDWLTRQAAYVALTNLTGLELPFRATDPPADRREQTTRWRMIYVVTDSRTVYRPGDNLHLLSPPRPGGRVTPLTQFTEGYVGEPEVPRDSRQVVFMRRGKDDPWWQTYRVNADGTGLVQLTDGPYHHAGPAFLPDGRILCAPVLKTSNREEVDLGLHLLEVPADRLLHLQVLDSERRVIGNQLTWIYSRPGETKSCVGCHENPHTTPDPVGALASHDPPLEFLPRDRQFNGRAKA